MNLTTRMCNTGHLELNSSHNTCIFRYCQNFSLKTKDTILAIVLYSIIAVGGSFGNMVVVFVIRQTPNLKTVCGVLIANLAIADLLVTAIAVPMFISNLAKGVLPQCSLDASSLVLIVVGRYSTSASLLMLAALSVDRCWAIVSPLSHKLKMTYWHLRKLLLLIWLVSPVIPILEVFSNAEQKLFLVRLKNAGVITCFVVIVMTGFITFMNVRVKSSKIRSLHATPGQSQISADLRERDHEVAKTIALVVVLFSLSWVPILTIVAIFPDHYSKLHFWTGLFGLANSALNPCIYFYRQRNYRKAFRRLVRSAFLSV